MLVIYDCVSRSEKITNVSGHIIDCLAWHDIDFILERLENQKMRLFNVSQSQEIEIGDADGSFAFNQKSGQFFSVNGQFGTLRHLDNWSAHQTIELHDDVDPIHIESLNDSSLLVLFKCCDAIILELIDFSTQEVREIRRTHLDATILKHAITNACLILLMENGEVLFLDLRTLQVVHRISSELPLGDVVVATMSNIISIGNKVYKIC
jgi:hypothetical protein